MFHDLTEKNAIHFLNQRISNHSSTLNPPDLAFGLLEVSLENGHVDGGPLVLDMGCSIAALLNRVVERL